MTVKPKTQRLALVAAAIAALVVAALLALSAMREEASFFVTPSELDQRDIAPGEPLRLGGMVAAGSLKTSADGLTRSFIVTDTRATTRVRYTGIVPNLFGEGRGVVADGRLEPGGVFVADRILAKHDERYMPPGIEDAMGQAGTGEETLIEPAPSGPGAGE